MKLSRQRGPHRGFVLISTIVCLMVASAVTANVMRRVVRQRRESQQRQWQDQAAWLAEAGMRHAATKLAQDPDYAGETWEPAIKGGAQVVITRKSSQLRVTADCPFEKLAPHRRARHSIEFPLHPEDPVQ